jgi:hypothetical protein
VLKGKLTRTCKYRYYGKAEGREDRRHFECISYFITGLTFLVMLSQNVHFITTTVLQERKKNMILEAILQAIHLH